RRSRRQAGRPGDGCAPAAALCGARSIARGASPVTQRHDHRAHNRRPRAMLPELMLLGFAAWTLALLVTTVGAYRLSRVFRGRAGMGAFPADRVEGQDWYKRSMRAHANCVENLPVFAVLVYAVRASGIVAPAVDPLCAV